jgi:cytochrome c oxidase assembly protein Cox11
MGAKTRQPRDRVRFRGRSARRETNRVVGALRDTITVKIDAEHFQDMQQRALVYQGGIILSPGEYKLKFLARENESGASAPSRTNFSLPPQPDRLQ